MDIGKMIKALCKYLSIAEIPNLNSKKEYEKVVSHLDYRYSFNKGSLYYVLGFTQLSGILHLYLVPDDGSYELDIGPAVLFECDWSKVPENWYVRMGLTREENFEFLPGKLSLIESWFEKYIDEDPSVLETVKAEINAMRLRYVTA